jgi:hypothetical protein
MTFQTSKLVLRCDGIETSLIETIRIHRVNTQHTSYRIKLYIEMKADERYRHLPLDPIS